MNLREAIQTAQKLSKENDRSYYVMYLWPKNNPHDYSIITRNQYIERYPIIYDCLYAFDAGDLLKAYDLDVVRHALNNYLIEPIVNPNFTTRSDGHQEYQDY